MRALEGELFLEAWERGVAEPELLRPLTLLDVAMPDTGRDRLGTMTVAECNLLLLDLHELSFGPMLDAVGTCERCEAPFEFSVPVVELRTIAASRAGDHVLSWRDGDRRYRLRAVTTEDLLGSTELADPHEAQEYLLSLCLVVSPTGSAERSPALLQKFDQLHAGTELICTITCPECGSQELVDLDIARFLWTEVRRAASRLLKEINVLAAGYGWSEQAILQLSARRRAAYLELLGE